MNHFFKDPDPQNDDTCLEMEGKHYAEKIDTELVTKHLKTISLALSNNFVSLCEEYAYTKTQVIPSPSLHFDLAAQDEFMRSCLPSPMPHLY